MSEEPFGSRLRRERERRQIALSSICANTKINVSLFEGLERGDVSRWPSGIFRRAFIRAYAQGVGLDPDLITREFLEQFPDPADSPPALATGLPSSTAAHGQSVASGIRLNLADPGSPFVGGRVIGGMRRRLKAIACDAGAVFAIAAAAFAFTGTFWLPLSFAMLGYYLGGILLLGNTPGVCLWAPRAGQTRALATVVTVKSAVLRTALAFRTRLSHREESTSVRDVPGAARP